MMTHELQHDCTEQEHIDWVLENQRYAGGFEYNLIEAWRRADNENKRRLEEAFPYDYRIPLGKPQRKYTEDEACDECGYYEDVVASHYEECSKLNNQ